MKTRFKHLLFAAVPFWIVQLVVLLTGYTDSRVILQIYLPAFIVVAQSGKNLNDMEKRICPWADPF